MMNTYSKVQIIDALQQWLEQTDFINKDVFQNLDSLLEEDLKKLLVIVYQAVKMEAKMDDRQKKYLSEHIQRFYGKQKMFYEQAQKDVVQYAEAIYEQEEKVTQEALLNQDVW